MSNRWTTEYLDEFVSPAEAVELLEILRGLPYRQDSSRGRLLKRRQCDFGASYAPSGRLGEADAIPESLNWIMWRVGNKCDAEFDQLICHLVSANGWHWGTHRREVFRGAYRWLEPGSSLPPPGHRFNKDP